MVFGSKEMPQTRDDRARGFFLRLSIPRALWRALTRDARHPIAAHFKRQLDQGRRIKVLPVSIGCGLLLLFAFANMYGSMRQAILWTIPLWLMLFSACAVAIWLGRMVALISRQARAGVMDEVGLIPPGRVFVYLVICKLVLNKNDALAWLTLLRRGMGGIVFISFLLSFCIAVTQVSQVSGLELLTLLLELLLMAVLFPLEHAQSVIIASLLAIVVSVRLRDGIDKSSVAFAGFALVQILTYSLALAGVIALEMTSLSIVIVLFLLLRELVVHGLWRLVLEGANEDDSVLHLAQW